MFYTFAHNHFNGSYYILCYRLCFANSFIRFPFVLLAGVREEQDYYARLIDANTKQVSFAHRKFFRKKNQNISKGYSHANLF